MRAMPHVQVLHDRYRDRGLTLLAISYEEPGVLRSFCDKNGYSFIVGSDPAKKVVGAYGVRGWPTSVLIGKDGKVAHVGTPYDLEAAVEKALGLEGDPAGVLTSWLESLRADDAKAQRAALARLVEKAPADFDLRSWAAANGGKAATGTGAAAKIDGAKALLRCVATWKSAATDRQAALDTLAASDATAFDLATFARRAYGERFPITAAEMKKLLEEKRYDAALDAILDRKPPGPALALAARDRGLRELAGKRAPEMRSDAKKGVMIRDWVLVNRQPKDNEGFWRELSVSGMALSDDKKTVKGVLVGGASVTKAAAPAFVQDRFARALVCEALAAGREPKLKGLDDEIRKEEQKVRSGLESKYGGTP